MGAVATHAAVSQFCSCAYQHFDIYQGHTTPTTSSPCRSIRAVALMQWHKLFTWVNGRFSAAEVIFPRSIQTEFSYVVFFPPG